MTIQTQSYKTTGFGNGATTDWTFDFYAPSDDTIKVTVLSSTGAATQLSSNQFTILSRTATGGSIRYPKTGTPLAVGYSIVIERVVPYTQPVDIVNQDGFYPEVVEQALDNLEMQIQQVRGRVTLPTGGIPGQVLQKSGAADFEVNWLTLTGTSPASSANWKSFILDYGADPSGAASANGAFASAIVAGGIVFIPSGIYTLTSQVSVNSPVTFVFGDNVVLNTTFSGISFLVTSSNVHFKGFGNAIINGPRTSNIANGTDLAFYFLGGSSAAYISNVSVKGLLIRNYAYEGIFTRWVSDAEFMFNDIAYVGYAGIMHLSGIRIKSNFNNIKSIGPGQGGVAPRLNAYGISYTRAAGSEAVDPRCQDCQAVGNTIDGIPSWAGLDTHGGIRILLALNEVKNVCVGAFVTMGGALAPKNVTLIGNIFTQGGNTPQSAGLYISGTAGGPFAESVKAVGNTFDGFGTDDPAVDTNPAVRCDAAIFPDLSNNHILNSRYKAIGMSQRIVAGRICDNTIKDINTVSGVNTGIDLSGGGEIHVLISGNTIARVDNPLLDAYNIGVISAGYQVGLARNNQTLNVTSANIGGGTDLGAIAL